MPNIGPMEIIVVLVIALAIVLTAVAVVVAVGVSVGVAVLVTVGVGVAVAVRVGVRVAVASPTDRNATASGAVLRTTRPLAVLVVEDNPINQRVTAALIEEMGHRTILASSGREALDGAMLTSAPQTLKASLNSFHCRRARCAKSSAKSGSAAIMP